MRLRPAIAMSALIALYPATSFGPSTHLVTEIPAAEAPAVSLPIAVSFEAPPNEPPISVAGTPPITEAEVAIADAVADDAPIPAEPDAGPQERVLVVTRGDTLAGLLSDAGVDSAEAHAAIASLSRHFRPTSLRPGDEIAIRLSASDSSSLLGIELEPEAGRIVRASRQPDGSWEDEQEVAPRTRFLVRATGTVDGGLFPAMTRAGMPPGMALSLIRILGHQVDFQRDLKPGDRFAILFDRFRDNDGDLLGHGQILKATLTLSGRTLEIWRYKDRDGSTEWYDQQGRSLRRSFLRTPLDGARISSGFGRRTHPVLGFNRMHQGIDFAAPAGTPIYAAADGIIVSAKREGGYGLMVRIRHNGGVETRYAHMSRFARNISSGRRVRQGTVIGAVGSTGLSTGPHLHYEVAVSGRPVNPAQHVQQAVRLAGAELSAFQSRQRRLTRLAAAFGTRDEVALAAD
jgi:murein DD-endopeptidase MepM/ murein hydrolase activator NlpD